MSEPSSYSACDLARWGLLEGGGRLNSHVLARKAGLDQVRFWRLLCNDQGPGAPFAVEQAQRRRPSVAGSASLAQLRVHHGLVSLHDVKHVGESCPGLFNGDPHQTASADPSPAPPPLSGSNLPKHG